MTLRRRYTRRPIRRACRPSHRLRRRRPPSWPRPVPIRTCPASASTTTAAQEEALEAREATMSTPRVTRTSRPQVEVVVVLATVTPEPVGSDFVSFFLFLSRLLLLFVFTSSFNFCNSRHHHSAAARSASTWPGIIIYQFTFFFSGRHYFNSFRSRKMLLSKTNENRSH